MWALCQREKGKSIKTKTERETGEGRLPEKEASPLLCALLSTEDGYCTLTGWFLIFFSRIFTLAADIFYKIIIAMIKKQPLFATHKPDSPNI